MGVDAMYNCPTSQVNHKTVATNVVAQTLTSLADSPYLVGGSKETKTGPGFVIEKPVVDPFEPTEYGQDLLHAPDAADDDLALVSEVSQTMTDIQIDVVRARICDDNGWDYSICQQIFDPKGSGGKKPILSAAYFDYLRTV